LTVSPRVIAVDWSGAMHGASRKIWLCEVRDGAVVRLESGRDRSEIEAHLLEEARRDSSVVIGLDFAFSLPAWFLHERGYRSAHDLWADVATGAGEEWLSTWGPPFWGRPGRSRPAAEAARPGARRCEEGTSAKSVFQIGGAGAVGTGSLRGMPMLHRLHAAGFRVWPYDDAGFPLVLEIYPRSLTGPVRKSSQPARERYVERWRATLLARAPTAAERPQAQPMVDDTLLELAAGSEDAFDALFSAVAMWRHIKELAALPAANDAVTRIEGAIWRPSGAYEGSSFAREAVG
jgi:hypothetical protein